MTTIDPMEIYAIDLIGLDRAVARVSKPDDAELHLLRLALDLQIDAMLLTLGAAARDDAAGVPWSRWLVEDLEQARTLTTTLLEADVEPASALGGVHGSAAVNALDNLVARYESMEQLLVGVLRRPHSGQPWRPATTEALTRCRTRLAELHAHRAAARAAAVAVPVPAGLVRSFLPGELLG
jgi:hypothetical protein